MSDPADPPKLLADVALHVGGVNVTETTNAFYLQYGRTVDAWSSLERHLSDCFRELTGLEARMAEAIFYSGRSFQTRRDLLLAVLPFTALQKDAADFLSAAFRRAFDYSKARNELAHRGIYYNTVAKRAEMREGTDNDLSSEGVTTLAHLANMQNNFQLLEETIFHVMFAAPEERASRSPQGIQRVRELPKQAHLPSPAKTTTARPTILVPPSRPRQE